LLRKIFISTLLFVCCAWIKIDAQQTYVLGHRGILSEGIPAYFGIFELDLFSGSRNLLFELDATRFFHPLETGIDLFINSFEFTLDKQQIYFMEREGDLYLYDIGSDQLSYIKDLTPISTPIWVHFYTRTRQIDRLNDSILLISGQTYGFYNTNSEEFTQTYAIPDFPSSSLAREIEITATRTTKHKDVFLYNGGNISLSLIDINDPENNTVITDYVPTSTLNLSEDNIISYQFDCDSTNLYFLHELQDIQIWKIDEESDLLDLVTTYNYFDDNNGYRVIDIQHYNATPWEDCQRIIDLDEDDSSGAVNIDYNNDSLCVHTDLAIVDVDVELKNEVVLDSVVVYIHDAIAGQQLQVASGNYDVVFSSDTQFAIISNGTTSLAELEQALISARYIDNEPYRSGDIEIIFEAWYRGVAGTAAIAYIHIPEKPYAGADLHMEFCVDDMELNLEEILEAEVTLGEFYSKEGMLLSSTIIDLSIVQELSLQYISAVAQCADTACIAVLVHTLPTTVVIEDINLCEGDSIMIDLSALEGQILWSDGSEDKLRVLTETKTYSYEHIDMNGCISTENFTLNYISSEVVEDLLNVEICNGDSYTYNGEIYQGDTIVLDTIVTVEGCDSIISGIVLSVIDGEEIILEGSTEFCVGDETMIEVISIHAEVYLDGNLVSSTMLFTEAGIYTLEVVDMSGCMEEIEIVISTYPTASIETVDLEDLEFTEAQNIEVGYTGDIVSYSWSPTEGLSCYDCPYPSLISPGIGQYVIEIEDSNGCMYRDQVRISYVEDAYYLPNIISSVAEYEENRSFHLMSNQSTMYDLIVYDRWGNVMYEAERLYTNEYSTGWIPDENIQLGVYVYIIRIGEGLSSIVKSGSITVVR